MVLDLRGERRGERATQKDKNSENGLRFYCRSLFVSDRDKKTSACKKKGEKA